MKQVQKNAIRTGSELPNVNRFRNVIVDSWKRCEDRYGLERYTAPKVDVLDSHTTRRLQEESNELLQISRDECRQLYQQTCRSGSIVALTNSDSVIIETIGDPSAGDAFEKCFVVPGAVWSEQCQGTNGMGTSIASNKLVKVYKSDHFFQMYHDLTCISAPIHDHQGKILGALDITTLNPKIDPEEQQYTCDLVQAATNYIEYQYFKSKFSGETLVHFHPRQESLGHGAEGLIALDENNRIVAINGRSLFFLKIKERDSIVGKSLQEVFESAASPLGYTGHQKGTSQDEFAIFSRESGRRYVAQISNQSPGPQKNKTSVVFSSLEENAMDLNNQKFPAFSFEKLGGSDSTMKGICDRLQRVLNKDINILITGETGTGKEEFARSIHSASKYANRPFVYLNCSGLTEPELFTELELLLEHNVDISDSGKKVVDTSDHVVDTPAANQQDDSRVCGTVFLDQISDLSKTLQQDVLHILQSDQITFPGRPTTLDMDCKVISADCETLQNIVDKNLLRPELYYRLNGINFKLQPIRDREDRAELIHTMLRMESTESGVAPQLSKRAADALMEYHWPGNFWELRIVLRTAIAMSDGRLIQIAHLPDLRTHRYADVASPNPEASTSSGVTDAQALDHGPVEMAERDAIIDALDECHWNISKATSVLKMSRSTLYRKIKKYDIELRNI